MTTKRARHLSALKGWRTRKANERARSERARAGWRTRKAKARKAKKAKKILLDLIEEEEWAVTIDYEKEGEK